MSYARIYRPAKTAMQSGLAKTQKWILEFESKGTRYREPLMGWTGTQDTQPQVRLKFTTLQEAQAYAKKHDLKCHVEEPREAALKPKSYGDNFN